MERAVYEAMAAEEGEHWWFVGRRTVLAGLIRHRVIPPPGAAVLDVGCGSGGNMAMLRDFGEVTGVEFDAEARAIAAARGIGPVYAGSLPDALDVPDGAFDLIALFDVLEHVEADTAALSALSEKLSPAGRLVISVPALPWLWSEHDEQHHHFRRYTRSSLCRTVTQAGMTIEGCGYFNTILFPAALVQRIAQRAFGIGSNAAAMPPATVNAVLSAVFSSERHLIGRVPLPIGLSLWAIAARSG